MKSNGRLISFESHIVDDVVKKAGGKYTASQVRDVFRSSVSYINNLCLYSENTEVSIPYIGKMVCNMVEMKNRHHNLTRLKNKIGCIADFQDKELFVLGIKIDDIYDYVKRNNVKNGNMLIKYNKSSIFKSRKGYTFKEIQSIQDQEFNF